MTLFTFSNSKFVSDPLTFKFLCVMIVSLGTTFQSCSKNEPAVIGHRTTKGKLLKNMQDRVTMETCPCEVLLSSCPFQSPWRPWQRTEYSNLPGYLPWQLRQDHFGDNLGPFLWRSCKAAFKGSMKSPLGGYKSSKETGNEKVSEMKLYKEGHRLGRL